MARSAKIDALGETAYYDNSGHTAELIPGCHRSQSAEVYIAGGVSGENLACSGAKTSSFTNSEGEFKPGLDFYNSGGHEGQALMLTNAGYKTSQYTILVQDYPSPIPSGSGFRYSQSGYTRQEVGGCGFWNADANWANEHALPTIDESVFHAGEKTGLTNIKYMQLSSWKSAGAVDKTEWINQVRTVSALFPPYELQEDLHPNYWAQLALRNCLTQAYNSGTPKSGACTISATGLNSAGEPNMSLK